MDHLKKLGFTELGKGIRRMKTRSEKQESVRVVVAEIVVGFNLQLLFGEVIH